MVVQSTPPGTLQTIYEVLNPLDRRNKETTFARISKEVFMGQAMFVVDIVVLSERMQKVPFFVAGGYFG
jgi:hypothetical protein